MVDHRAAAHPYLDHPGPIPFAHRGGAGDWPENTMPAFRSAVAMGYRYVETDVQATRDGVLLAFHDNDLARTCGRPGTISSLPYSEITTARVSGLEPIPLLDQLIEEFPETLINIDCKTDAGVEPLIAAIRRHRLLDRVCVGSFSHRRITKLRQALGSELLTAMSPTEVVKWRVGRPGTGAVAQVPVRQGPITVVSKRTVEVAHRRGFHVHVWTIDEAAEMKRLLDLGVDGIVTDRPAVLKQVLQQRGLWH